MWLKFHNQSEEYYIIGLIKRRSCLSKTIDIPKLKEGGL